MEFSLNQIATATGGAIVRAENSADRPLRIVTDSREAAPDTIFWAMHGTAHDGHEFVDAALANGAAACVVSAAWAAHQEGACDGSLITVADTLQALAALAAWNRQRWPVRVIGITGSFGKTTTREMVHAVLSQKFESLRSPKNFNNQFGVPLTLLQLKPHHDVAVVELGASACGEIRRLSRTRASSPAPASRTPHSLAARRPSSEQKVNSPKRFPAAACSCFVATKKVPTLTPRVHPAASSELEPAKRKNQSTT
jgi:UDP-N-acetylmuramyl pentapeptide synthase